MFIQIDIVDAPRNLDMMLANVALGNKYIIYKDGEPIAVMVSPDDIPNDANTIQ